MKGAKGEVGWQGERGKKGDNGTMVMSNSDWDILIVYNIHREIWECKDPKEKKDLKALVEIWE